MLQVSVGYNYTYFTAKYRFSQCTFNKRNYRAYDSEEKDDFKCKFSARDSIAKKVNSVFFAFDSKN